MQIDKNKIVGYTYGTTLLVYMATQKVSYLFILRR